MIETNRVLISEKIINLTQLKKKNKVKMLDIILERAFLYLSMIMFMYMVVNYPQEMILIGEMFLKMLNIFSGF